MFTSGSRAGYLLNWNQVATIKQSHKQTTLRLCNTLCWFLVSLFSLVNGQILSLPYHCAVIILSSPPQCDQQDQAWYHQKGEQTAYTYCWAGKSFFFQHCTWMHLSSCTVTLSLVIFPCWVVFAELKYERILQERGKYKPQWFVLPHIHPH